MRPTPPPPNFGRPVGWMPLPDVAEVLGVSPRKVARLIHHGPLLAAYKVGELMVSEAHLALFVSERRRW